MGIKKELQDLCDRYKAEAEAMLNKAKAEKKAWKPENGESCYNILNGGLISHEIWFDSVDLFDNFYAIGNCFPTKEAAEFAVEKLKVIAELKRFAEEHNEPIDWEDEGTGRYFIEYNLRCDMITVDGIYNDFLDRNICFSSEEIAKAAIEAIGEERLKKYYFEVDD